MKLEQPKHYQEVTDQISKKQKSKHRPGKLKKKRSNKKRTKVDTLPNSRKRNRIHRSSSLPDDSSTNKKRQEQPKKKRKKYKKVAKSTSDGAINSISSNPSTNHEQEPTRENCMSCTQEQEEFQLPKENDHSLALKSFPESRLTNVQTQPQMKDNLTTKFDNQTKDFCVNECRPTRKAENTKENLLKERKRLTERAVEIRKQRKYLLQKLDAIKLLERETTKKIEEKKQKVPMTEETETQNKLEEKENPTEEQTDDLVEKRKTRLHIRRNSSQTTLLRGARPWRTRNRVAYLKKYFKRETLFLGNRKLLTGRRPRSILKKGSRPWRTHDYVGCLKKINKLLILHPANTKAKFFATSAFSELIATI